MCRGARRMCVAHEREWCVATNFVKLDSDSADMVHDVHETDIDDQNHKTGRWVRSAGSGKRHVSPATRVTGYIVTTWSTKHISRPKLHRRPPGVVQL